MDAGLVAYLNVDAQVRECLMSLCYDPVFRFPRQVSVEVGDVIVLDTLLGRLSRAVIPERLEQSACDQHGTRDTECWQDLQ